jgi:hypothetical protein
MEAIFMKHVDIFMSPMLIVVLKSLANSGLNPI